MADLTVASFEEMEPIFDGIARRARATLGVSAFGMQVMTLPADWDGYPNHRHDAGVDDADQEEVYIPLNGSATLVADDQRVELQPGMMVRVGPDQHRRILPGPDGIQFVALGGVPGAFSPSAWTELGGPSPVPPHDELGRGTRESCHGGAGGR
jgi:hypothetical protein